MKHTPGPWGIENDTITSTSGDIGRVNFQSCRGVETEKANALLIASAPEMFKALEAFVKEREKKILALGYKSVEAYDKLVNHEEAYAIAKRAIAKVKGE